MANSVVLLNALALAMIFFVIGHCIESNLYSSGHEKLRRIGLWHCTFRQQTPDMVGGQKRRYSQTRGESFIQIEKLCNHFI